MKQSQWLVSLVLALVSFGICIGAQNIPQIISGSPVLLFPTDLYNQIELIGFVTGVVGVYLMVKQSPYNYPIGLIWAIAYAWYFFKVAGHFGEAAVMIINAFYLVDGWIKWSKKGEQPDLPVTHLKPNNWITIFVTLAVAIPVLIFLLIKVRGNFVYFDATTTALALTAQYLTNRKVFESWYFWIAANSVIIPVFIYRQYYPTAILYLIFTIMAVRGIIEWKRSMNNPRVST